MHIVSHFFQVHQEFTKFLRFFGGDSYISPLFFNTYMYMIYQIVIKGEKL